MDEIFLVNSSSFQDVEISASLRAGPSIVVDFTQASVVSGSFSGPGQGLTDVSASYIAPSANVTASYTLTASFVESASYSNTSSWAINAINGGTQIATGSTYPITSSWAETSSLSITSVSSSFSTSGSVVQSASYIIPGATFYQVSGSDGIPASYIEPYDYSKDNVFRPASKEGRTYWDHKWVNWKVWQDTDYSSSTATALNVNLGRELNIAVHNPANATLARGTPVYLSGSQTSSIYPFNQTWPQVYKPDVYKAIADGTGTKSEVVGLVRNAIPAYHDGYICIRGEMHNTNLLAYGDVIGTKLWLSTDTAGGITITEPAQPYEVVQLGWLTETGSQGSILVNIETVPPPANAYAGMTSIPTITDFTGSQEVAIGSGSVNLYKNPTGAGAITQFPVSEVTFSVPAGYSAYFVYATTDTVTASYQITTDFSIINGTDKILVTTLYRADEDAHWMESQNEGLALANKLNTRLLETERFAWESGFTLISTGSNFVTVTEGSLWFGATKLTQDNFDSFNTQSVTPRYETHWAHHSASAWSIPIQLDGKWNNFYYDNGITTASLATDSWSLHYVYRILGENPFDEDIFLVTSNYQYSSFVTAQADIVPTGVPAVLNDIAILVGRLIFQSGSITGSVESAFTTDFGQSTVTIHDNLGGLQGGQGGEYYHLKAQEYSDFQGATGTGIYVRQNNASITGSITTASFVTLAQTASYIGSAVSASYAATSSWAVNAINGGTSITTGSTYPITASWATNATSASYASASTSGSYSISSSWSANAAAANVFSRGGTFFDPAGITLSTSASIIVWRAPFNCSVTAVHGCMVAQSATATASVNARRNGVGSILANPIFVTASNSWFSNSSPQTSSFSTGDRLEIILVSSSLFPTQSSIQVDFIKV